MEMAAMMSTAMAMTTLTVIATETVRLMAMVTAIGVHVALITAIARFSLC
jgi:hypothetical protein